MKKHTINEKYKKELIHALLLASKDKKLFADYMEDLLTPQEYSTIILRWQIVQELTKGTPQRAIAKKLGLGVATITRGSTELKDKKGGFSQLLKKLAK